MPARTGRRWREKTVPRVLRRDHGICHLCGQPGADTADHLVPAAHGGDETMANLKAAHVKCNTIRGARSVEVARADILKRLHVDTTGGWDW